MIDKNKMVTTVSGKTAKRGDCRKIGTDYYIIGDVTKKDSGECYLINERYYKYNTGYIVYDYTLEKYVIKNNNVIYGVTEIDKDDNLIMGYFSLENGYSKEDYPTVQVSNPDNIFECSIALSDDIFKGTNYIYIPSDDLYRKRFGADAIKIFAKAPVSSDYKRSLFYSCKNMDLSDYKTRYDKYVPKEMLKTYGADFIKYFKKHTFGLEFETSLGMIPKRRLKNLGLIPLRDGSIRGLEYVTLPYKGVKGLDSLYNVCDLLKKTTEYDNDCSLHLHVGGVPRTEKYFLSLFRVLSAIQEDVYEMFPIYKRTNYGIKRKSYTKPLPAISLLTQMDSSIDSDKLVKKNFAVLYKYLSNGQSYSNRGSDLSNVHAHPADPGGRAKWNIKTRYHWVNMIPLLFENKQTIEFRIHTPTYDYNKIVNFLFICICILSYAEQFQHEILKESRMMEYITLREVVSKATRINMQGCDNISAYREELLSYISNREKFISQNITMNNVNPKESNFKCNNNLFSVKRNESIPRRKKRNSIDIDMLRRALHRQEEDTF